MAIKNYSFNLDTVKHIDIIEWIKEQKENELNFSALMRKLLKEEITRRKDAETND